MEKYKEIDLVTFSIDIEQQQVNGKWKKKIKFPTGWTSLTLDNKCHNKNMNGLALLTGRVNNLMVIDIDNTDHWNTLLEIHNKKEPNTPKVITGSGGIHYFFKYENIEGVKSKDHCFGKDYDIDIKTDGGCVIVPPSTYINKNIGKNVVYKWEISIFDVKPKKIPEWIKNLLIDNSKNMVTNQKNTKKNTEVINNDTLCENNKDIEIEENKNTNYTSEDIKKFVGMLSDSRRSNYNDWLNVGICLYNISTNYFMIWNDWSFEDDKYATGECEKKWKTFKKNKNGLNIGSLLLWAKTDNSDKYSDYIKNKNMQNTIISKYPNDNIVLGESKQIGDIAMYTMLKNNKCLIKGDAHEDMKESMYIEIIGKFMTIKCRHQECFGLTYYQKGHLSMTKNETNIFFGNVTININNNKEDNDVIFEDITIHEDSELNKLLTDCLNGGNKHGGCAEILFYMYKDIFAYAEDYNWYKFENNKWKNIGCKNMELRSKIKRDLIPLYKEILKIFPKNKYAEKWNYINGSLKMFEDAQFKNHIMTELMELYVTNNNINRDFLKKLDSNRDIIGFNNGVFDLVKFEFRKTEPVDYISMTVGYDYSENYTGYKEHLMRFLEDILPNKLERDYVLTYISLALTGNVLELFTIFTNSSGRNGKSKLFELLKHTFGDYFASLKSQIFTRPCPNGNSPDPCLLNLINKRIVVTSEPSKGEKLNVGFIKFITGRDNTTLRNCHSNEMVEFMGNFILLFACNDIPDCDDIDVAFSKRLRCVNFPTEFVDNPVLPHQKKINVDINKNFHLWKYDMIRLLMEYYKIYMVEKILTPTKDMLRWAEQYREKTDTYLQFINERIIADNNNISLAVLHAEYKLWLKDEDPTTKPPIKKIFKIQIQKYLGEPEKVWIDNNSVLGFKKIGVREE